MLFSFSRMTVFSTMQQLRTTRHPQNTQFSPSNTPDREGKTINHHYHSKQYGNSKQRTRVKWARSAQSFPKPQPGLWLVSASLDHEATRSSRHPGRIALPPALLSLQRPRSYFGLDFSFVHPHQKRCLWCFSNIYLLQLISSCLLTGPGAKTFIFWVHWNIV